MPTLQKQSGHFLLCDAESAAIAAERMSRYDRAKNISVAEMLNYLGISADDIANIESIEIE